MSNTRITAEQATAQYGKDVIYTLAESRKAIPRCGTDGRTYDAKKLTRQVKKAGR
ncbi:hypothetical protein [Nonomuraea ceibae]|uniref:hypothetical protein n=1 Tax=Nonomuraea ceibae TaxID=1935170 RepID=UPI001C5D838F|nr:hypothetical protein [Nonomuraea ceibae]